MARPTIAQMRLIDADALLDDFRKTIEACKKWKKDAKDPWTETKAEQAQRDFVAAVLRVKAAPTVDAVPVVRCAMCRFYEDAEYDGCTKLVCRLFGRQMQDDDYCSYGERKGGEG